MNKKIVFLLVLSMLLQLLPNSVGTLAAGAINDVKGTVYERAVSRLNSLGIMVGDESGFRPNDSIKRSEFAAVLVRALGVELSAQTLMGETKFEDVPPEHWASGYVKVATETGIIKGMSDTIFAPDDDITYEQAVTMIIRVLGYEDEANSKGGYPTGFMVTAYNLDLFRNIPDFGKQTDAAIRGMVGFMLDNALEIPLMINYGSTYLYTSTGLTNELVVQTLLESRMRLNKYECIINDIKFGDNDTKLVFTVTKAKDISFVGRKMECIVPDYLNSDLNIMRDVNSIVSVYERDREIFGIRSESEVIFDYVQDINGKNRTSDINSEVSATDFNKIDNIRFKSLNLSYPIKKDDNNINNLNNGDIKLTKAGNTLHLKAPSELLSKFVKAVVQNGNIVYIHAYDLSEGGRITDTSIPSKIDFIRNQNDPLSVRRATEDEQLLVLINNKPALFSDLKTDHLFDYYKHENILMIVASSLVEEDKLTGYSEKDDITTVKFGDIAYDLSVTPPVYYSVDDGETYSSGISALDTLAGSKCTAYIDAKSEIRFILGNSGVETEPFYGLITGYYTDEFNYLRVYKFNADGSFKKANVAVKDASTFQKAVKSYENMQKQVNWPSYHSSGQYHYSDTLDDMSIIGRFIPNQKGEITEILPLENSGWVTGPVNSADTRTNSLFAGDSRYTGSGINEGGDSMPNRITSINKNDIRFKLSGQSRGDDMQIDYASDTMVIGIWDNFGEITVQPISSSQLEGRKRFDIIGMKFHINQVYNYSSMISLVNNSSLDYTADFIVIYGIDNLTKADLKQGFFYDFERTSDQYYTGNVEEIQWNNTIAPRSALLKRNWVEGIDLLEYMRSGSRTQKTTLSGSAFISYWNNMLSPVDNITISVDTAIKVVGVLQVKDIKSEFRKAQESKESVVKQVYNIKDSTYFTTEDSSKYTINSNIVVYEYDPYGEVFEFSSYKNISRYDYILPIDMPRDNNIQNDFRLKIVIFQKY